MKTLIRSRIFLCSIALAVATHLSAATWYVKPTGNNANTGNSWGQAFQTIQQAIASATAGDQIWVAAGTYKPTTGTDRTIAIGLKAGVSLYGGFPASGTPTFSNRDWVANPTILSGEIGDPGPADNSWHVLYNDSNGLTTSDELDGFIIRDGNADGGGITNNSRGAGMSCNYIGLTIRNCTFANNQTSGNGGGIFAWNSTIVLGNCKFYDNFAGTAGAIAAYSSTTFTITNTTFLNNAGKNGAALEAYISSANIINCSFNGNSATNANFSNAVIFAYISGTINVVNSIFWGNSVQPFYVFSGASLSTTYSIVEGGATGTGNLNLDPLFEDPANGDFHLGVCSPAIDAGTNTGAPNNDLDDNPRPRDGDGFGGATADMGAYEFQSERPLTASCKPAIVNLDQSGNASLDVAQLNNNSSGCGPLSFLVDGQSTLNYTCNNIGQQTVYLTVTDAFGKSRNCSASVTVQDKQAPAITCKAITVTLNAAGAASITAADVLQSSSDNCGTVNLVSVAPNTFGCNNLGSNTVLLSASDSHGNTANCSSTVTVIETTPPSISCKPASISLNESGLATLAAADVFLSGSDNCGGTVSPQTVSPNNFNCSHIGSNLVYLTATDARGNQNTCSATVTVSDDLPPTVECASATIYLDAQNNASIEPEDVLQSSGDNCGTVNLESVSPNTFSCLHVGINTVTLSANDGHGNQTGCSATVVVVDATQPTVSCKPATLSLDANGNATLSATDIYLSGSDNCGTVNIQSISLSDFNCTHLGANTVSLVVDDSHGNSNSCTATVTVIDQALPTLSCKNLGINLDATGNASITTNSVFLSGADNCGTVNLVSVVPGAFSCLHLGANMVTLSANDGHGNTTACTAVVTVSDNIAPSVLCKNATVNLNGAGQASITPNAVFQSGADNCGTVNPASVSPATFNCSSTGQRIVTLVVNDGHGNTNTCTATVTVRDLALPTFTNVPANVIVQCHAVPAVGTAVATDNCSATVVYNGQTVSGVTCTDTYILIRKWTATDPSGNTRTATQKITVRDIQAPTFTASPAHITVQCSNIPAPGTPTATDNCDLSVAISYNGETRTNGACTDSYVLTRRWTAADNCGNIRSVTQRITVQDTQKPVFTSTPQNLTLQCSDDLPAIITPTASDNCDASVAVAFLGETTANAACAGNYQVLRIWTATDNCGNSTAFTQTISIQDNQAPVFTNVPQHLTIECSDLVPAIGQATASDACGGYVQVLFQGQTMTPGSCPANRTILRTWMAQDECGNAATATQTISIQDTQAPSFSNAPANLSIACGAALPSLPAVLAIDNCDTYVPVTYLGETSTGPNCPYTVTRTWTVADDCGNASTHTQIISVGAQNAGSGAEPEARTEEELQTSIGQSEIRLFPNPARDEVWISLNSDMDTEAQLLFFDLSGRLVLQQQVPVEEGENQFRVPLADVPAGLYLVLVQQAGGKSSTHRLVVGKD